MVDCRSLIEFCRSFDHHRQTLNPQSSPDSRTKKFKSPNPKLSHPFCDQSPQAAIDVFMLILVLGSIGVLSLPCFQLIYAEASHMFPAAVDLIGEFICAVHVAYATALALMALLAVALWEIVNQQFRKCGNPKCRGMRKAVEFDIQLESEECAKFVPARDAFVGRKLDLGRDHKELEAELRKMAPLNGRTVLIFRSPCGCPAGRMEVWGQKKVRRVKK